MVEVLESVQHSNGKPAREAVLIFDPKSFPFGDREGPTGEPATKSLTACGMENWYRYGDSNPGPVAENHVS